MRTELDESELDECLGLGLRVILSRDITKKLLQFDPFLPDVAQAVGEDDFKSYYYRGHRVFVGDVTKELVTAALVANREKQQIVLVRQPRILSNFSGIECPIANGQTISDDDMNKVFDYVEALAKVNWEYGTKYFYGTPIR